MLKRTIVGALALAGALGAAVIWLATRGTLDTEEVVYPEAGQRTAFRLRQLQARLFAYEKENGALPGDLRVISGRGSETLKVDEWNRPVLYHLVGTGFEVRSVGPDGLPNSVDDIVVPSSVRDEHDTNPAPAARRRVEGKRS